MLRQGLNKWLAGLDEEPSGLYLVGGSVRDLLLGRRTNDIDLACMEAKSLARRLASARNAALVAMEKDPSVPCYRVVDRNSPEDFLDIAKLRGPDIRSDLIRRDFTINAMALELDFRLPGFLPENPSESLIDPLSGRDDLRKKVIRGIGEKNLEDDPLRILRAFRLAGELGFSIEQDTFFLFAKKASLLASVSEERITKELLLLFSCSSSLPQVRAMDASGVLEAVFPQIRPMKGCGQNKHHHLDVWEHSMATMEGLERIIGNGPEIFGDAWEKVLLYLGQGFKKPLLKIAALLHDIGKPKTRGVRPGTGAVTFYGHEKAGEEMVIETAQRLRMGKADGAFLGLMAREHMAGPRLFGPGVREKTRMAWFRRLGEDAVAALLLSMADTGAKAGASLSLKEKKERSDRAVEAVRRYYETLRARLSAGPLITGADLIGLGMAPGPAMGKVLAAVRAAGDSGEIKTREEALEVAARLLKPSSR